CKGNAIFFVLICGGSCVNSARFLFLSLLIWYNTLYHAAQAAFWRGAADVYIEKRYMKKIGKVFEALSIPLRLVDAFGACLVPEDGEPASLPAGVLAQGLNHHAGLYFFRVLDVHPPLYLVAPESAPGAEDVLCVADAMIMSL